MDLNTQTLSPWVLIAAGVLVIVVPSTMIMLYTLTSAIAARLRRNDKTTFPK